VPPNVAHLSGTKDIFAPNRKLIFGNMTTSGKLNIALAMSIIRTAVQRTPNPIEILRDIAVKETTTELLKRFGLPTTMPPRPFSP